eukprot:gnl/TRDRNA2_/TRDRNA2_181637_c0_seq1.p1 gnl/TRDRNA2_/TRDRNA2_181637_c0~~gnl/TRDRNA2_/TRDRNA2_181637_c0_seq1.p1  ORF type:complete len:533 (-),score=124.40 gnl/TRDRNA2_/TRDRNA2_181637_c0_seq1:284-1882(-)
MKRGHDAAMEDVSGAETVVCCQCGVPMAPNQLMRCAQCLRSEVDIVGGISRQIVLHHCRTCQRYNKPPWTTCELESRELLGMCLKKIKGLGRELRLVDAAFVWTEEHSKRIKVKITVQKEVANASVLQQTMVVEFQVVNMQCEDCQKSFTPHTWNAVVQVRQKVQHRRTFCYLEQLILKHDAHDKLVSLKESREGLDFHFLQKSHAQKFVDFVQDKILCKIKTAKQLVSHDTNSNTYNYKYTMHAELCSVCVDDIVHVPTGHLQLLNSAAPLMLCYKVSTTVHLVDPLTCQGVDIPSTEYWSKPVYSVCNRKHLTEFVVLNVELVDRGEVAGPAGTAPKHHLAGRGKFLLADIEVAKASDFGVNDNRVITRSHLGRALRVGDSVLGYDLRTVSVSGIDSEPIEEMQNRADVFLVRKHYKKRKGRKWDVQRLDREKEEGNMIAVDDEQDMEDMRRDLEEDVELRKNVNMFRNENVKETKSTQARRAAEEALQAGSSSAQAEQGGDDEEEDEDAPEVPLAELLEGLTLETDPNA